MSGTLIRFLLWCQGRSDGMIDLHGLYVREALEYAELAFELAALEDGNVVRFIVGAPSLLRGF